MLSTLAWINVRAINFKMFGHHVRSFDFSAVRTLVELRKIEVEHLPSTGGSNAHYSSGSNTLTLGLTMCDLQLVVGSSSMSRCTLLLIQRQQRG